MKRADWRSLAVLLATLGLLGWGFFKVDVFSFSFVLYLIPACALCFICSVINHNHVHHKTFRSEAANRIFETLLTAARGHTSATVWLPHNRNHHHLNGADGDWITPKHVNQSQNLKALVTYVFKSMVTMRRKRKLDEVSVPRSIQKKQNWQRRWLFLFIISLLIIDPISAVAVVGLPWFFGAALLVGVNLFQHAECDPTSDFEGSRNFVGEFENWLFFNNGLHTAHHLYPSVHWSEIPLAHAKISKKIPDHLIRKSLVFYVLTQILGKGETPSQHTTADISV